MKNKIVLGSLIVLCIVLSPLSVFGMSFSDSGNITSITDISNSTNLSAFSTHDRVTDATAKNKIESLVIDQVYKKRFGMKSDGIAIADVQSENYEHQQIYIYFDHKPTSDKIHELNSLGVSLDIEYWIPPIGPHPYGFAPADAPANIDLLKNVAGLDFVTKVISAERPHILLLDRSVPATRADIISDVGIFGTTFDGSGVRVAVIDTGYDYVNNQHLKEPVVKHHYIPWWPDNEDITDKNGHGTHVAGTIVSSNTTYHGVAPGVDLIFLDVASGTTINGDITQAIKDAVDKYHADVISMSIGGGEGISSHRDGTDPDSQAVDYASSEGATVIISAGNAANDNKHIHGTAPAGASSPDYLISVSKNSTPIFYLVWDNSAIDLDFELYKDINHDGIFEPEEIECPNPLGGTEWYTHYWDNVNLDDKGFLDDNVEFITTFDTDEDWMIKVINNGDSDQSFDLYQDNSEAGVTFVDATPDRTLIAPAVAEGAIAVGSYAAILILKN